MFRRGAARLVTGPAGFLVAGIVDVLAFMTVALREAARRRRAAR